MANMVTTKAASTTIVWMLLIGVSESFHSMDGVYPPSGTLSRQSTTTTTIKPTTTTGLYGWTFLDGSDVFSVRNQPEITTKRFPDLEEEWGIHRRYGATKPVFPSTPLSVARAAFQAVAATMYGKETMDPHHVANAMSTTPTSRRPIRREHDRGRIGIEIEGAQYLWKSSSSPRGPRQQHGKEEDDPSALRQISLLIGAQLSEGPWEGIEDKKIWKKRMKEEKEKAAANGKAAANHPNDPNKASLQAQDAFRAASTFHRPVVLYFNTIKQTLVASRELALLKQLYSDRFNFDHITIACLGQDKEIPAEMHAQSTNSKARSRRIARGTVDPTRGVIMVVQPTDFNNEFRPPGPSIGTLTDLQQLSMRAQVHGLPVVMVSPRFMSHTHHQYGYWDQSGYHQSEFYGGVEPARGPTPWIMRDFTPPVFSWIGSALWYDSANSNGLKPSSASMRKRSRTTRQSVLDHGQGHNQQDDQEGHERQSEPQRLVLCQSVVDEGHEWHAFAAKTQENKDYDGPDTRPATMKRSTPHQYSYLGSTGKAAGRPTTDVIRHILHRANTP